MALTPAERAKKYREKLKNNPEKAEEVRQKQLAHSPATQATDVTTMEDTVLKNTKSENTLSGNADCEQNKSRTISTVPINKTPQIDSDIIEIKQNSDAEVKDNENTAQPSINDSNSKTMKVTIEETIYTFTPESHQINKNVNPNRTESASTELAGFYNAENNTATITSIVDVGNDEESNPQTETASNLADTTLKDMQKLQSDLVDTNKTRVCPQATNDPPLLINTNGYPTEKTSINNTENNLGMETNVALSDTTLSKNIREQKSEDQNKNKIDRKRKSAELNSVQVTATNSAKMQKDLAELVLNAAPLTFPAMVQIQGFLGLQLATLENKSEIEMKIKTREIRRISDHVLQKAGQCTGIFMINFPIWFKPEHYQHVLRLLTDFDWNARNNFIEILKYANNTDMGAILIKFANSDICFDVFQQLRRVSVLQKHIRKSRRLEVQLDIYGNSEKMGIDEDPSIKWINMKLDSTKFRMRSVVTELQQQERCPHLHKEDMRIQSESQTQPQPESNESTDSEESDEEDVIMIPQNIPEVDLTEDANEEYTERSKKKNFENKVLQTERIDEDSDEFDRTRILPKLEDFEPTDDLSELIYEDRRGIPQTSIIAENADVIISDDETDISKLIYEDKKGISLTNKNIDVIISDDEIDLSELIYEDKRGISPTKNIDVITSNYKINRRDIDSDDDGTEDKCKIVHVINLTPNRTLQRLKGLIKRHTNLIVKKNYRITQLKCNGYTSECLIKFNNHKQAVEVARCLDGIGMIQASLDIGHKLSKSITFDSKDRKSHKRKKWNEIVPSQPKTHWVSDDCPQVMDTGCTLPNYYSLNAATTRTDVNSSDNFKSDTLEIKNLPSSVPVVSLGKKMEEVGEIIFAEFIGKGTAVVRFKKVEDAERCIRLFHRSKVNGQIIDVVPL